MHIFRLYTLGRRVSVVIPYLLPFGFNDRVVARWRQRQLAEKPLDLKTLLLDHAGEELAFRVALIIEIFNLLVLGVEFPDQRRDDAIVK